MNLIEKIETAFNLFILNKYNQNVLENKNISFELNVDESKKDFGDISSNAAMVLAKVLKKKPLDIAQEICEGFKHDIVQKIEIAGPGFLNIFLKNEAFVELLKDLFESKEGFFKLPEQAKRGKFSVEFVSANPTGPLHIGHGRGGIIGDVLGNILRFLGNEVIKEFYINDAGSQIQKLGLSLKIRCQQELGGQVEMPEESYKGEYLIELAKLCIKENGKSVLSKDDTYFENYAKDHLLKEIKRTLDVYGIHFDVWFSEKQLHDSGKVKEAVEKLIQSGHTYEQDGALWFRSTAFGDDKDRVIRKANGELTYAAADIAYMIDKIERGADHLIMVLGQDHHSYAVRLDAIRKALNLEKYPLDVILYQLVKMKVSGELVRMSKRAGNIVTLKDLIETVGKDVARFFYLNRKADAQLEFDLDLALKRTEENPVYYAQYAYVRMNSLLQKAYEEKDFQEIISKDIISIGTEEYFLIKKLTSLKNLLKNIGENYQIHLLTYYILQLAGLFHKYYFDNKIIDKNNVSKSRARLLLVITLKNSLETCLKLIGIDRPEKM